MIFKSTLILDHLKPVCYGPGSVNSDWNLHLGCQIETHSGLAEALLVWRHILRINLKTIKSRIIIIMIVSPLCGYMGDRYDRKFATLFSIFIWSASNFASTFCVSSQEIILTKNLDISRVVQTQAILFLISMSERDGSDIERLSI